MSVVNLRNCRTKCWPTALIVLLLTSGCQSSPPRGEVEGVITLDDVPLDGVQVTFVPVAGDNPGVRTCGFTDDEGTYSLMDDHGKTGTVIGAHKVTVTDPRSFRNPLATEEDRRRPEPSRVPRLYTAISTTPLRVEVEPGSQTVDLKLTVSRQHHPSPVHAKGKP